MVAVGGGGGGGEVLTENQRHGGPPLCFVSGGEANSRLITVLQEEENRVFLTLEPFAKKTQNKTRRGVKGVPASLTQTRNMGRAGI